jgi:hypothetical protein
VDCSLEVCEVLVAVQDGTNFVVVWPELSQQFTKKSVVKDAKLLLVFLMVLLLKIFIFAKVFGICDFLDNPPNAQMSLYEFIIVG